MNHILFITFAILAALSLVVWAAGQVSAHIKLRRRRAPARHLPAISILKPMKGASEELRVSLEALVRQNYPRFEILCCAEDPCDPALKVARSVQALHPEVSIRILSAPPHIGLNPKVSFPPVHGHPRKRDNARGVSHVIKEEKAATVEAKVHA